MHGLHAAAPSAPVAKQKSQTDPTKGLRDAIKAKEVLGLALQAASMT